MVNKLKTISKEEKERKNGIDAGKRAAKYGYKRAIFGENDNRGMVYQIAYNKAYDEASASFNEEEKERRKESNAGRKAAKCGYNRAIFGENNNRSIIYQNAYNESFDREVARKDKSKRDFPHTHGTTENDEEFFYPQQNLFLSPGFPDFSTPDKEYTLDYSEKLNPPQESDTVINSVEELSHYLDSLTSPTPDAHPLNPLLLPDKATSLDFDRVDNLLGVYETIQPTSLYQPLFFSTLVPQEAGIMQEAAPIHFIADRII